MRTSADIRIAVYSTEWYLFEYYEPKDTKMHNRRCIDGRITGSNKCVGYCRFNGHPGFLTEKLRNKHDCIAKGCDYYIGKQRSNIKNKYEIGCY